MPAMRRSRHVLLVALLALCVPAALGGLFGGSKAKSAAASGEGEVLVLSGAESFDAAVKAHSFLVVEFYAPVRGWAQAPRRTAGRFLQWQWGLVNVLDTRPVLRTTRTPLPPSRCGRLAKREERDSTAHRGRRHGERTRCQI